MAELNKIRLLLVVLLMVFPAHAFDVLFSRARADFKYRASTRTVTRNGQREYDGTVGPVIYKARPGTTKVIVYIIDRSRYVEIVRNSVRTTRLGIAQELRKMHCELVFLGIENFNDDEHHLIGSFLLDKIRSPQLNFTIETIGEGRFDHNYKRLDLDIIRYQENAQIFGGVLQARLRSIKRGALRPVGNNDKEIRLYGFNRGVQEVMWPVNIENEQYVAVVDVTVTEYDLRLKHPDKKICLLVLDGKKYLHVTGLAQNSPQMQEIRKYLSRMRSNDEVFYIMGAFNFDWSEVYIVTQIILQHTRGWQISDYVVSVCGFGMFNTFYENRDEGDGRYIRQPQDSNAIDIMIGLLREPVKERAINVKCSRNEWKDWSIPINLSNGKYVPSVAFNDLNFSWVSDERIAFIVYESTEVNPTIDQRMLHHSVNKLNRSNIYAVVIEAINFEMYDIHIIAEWVEEHRGHFKPEQIVILGGGTFDTLFQSQHTTYNTFFNIKKNELRAIRNAYVMGGNEKSVMAAKIDDAHFETWLYKMNTIVNGAYEPDLIRDKNMFDTTSGRKILFIIASEDNFRYISALPDGGLVASFRETINNEFPISEWNVYLVGLRNFREIDAYRFAELVKTQTNDDRSLKEFVHVLHYGLDYAVFQYSDTDAFPVEFSSQILTRFTWLLRTAV